MMGFTEVNTRLGVTPARNPLTLELTQCPTVPPPTRSGPAQPNHPDNHPHTHSHTHTHAPPIPGPAERDPGQLPGGKHAFDDALLICRNAYVFRVSS